MGRNSAELLRRLAEGPPIISDGGMGAQLLQRGWQGPTEDANLHAPETVEEIHRAFVSAGAELILTNTFMLPFRPEQDIEEIFRAALARARAASPRFVAVSVGPSSWSPTAPIPLLLRLAGLSDVDAIFIETVRSASEFVDETHLQRVCQVFASQVVHPILFSYVPLEKTSDIHLRLVAGNPAASTGYNCGDPNHAIANTRLLPDSHSPLSLRPSAGIPTGEGRSLQWPVRPAAFGDFAEEAAALGARIIGGCCGASPDHIAAIADRLRSTR